MQAVGTSFGVRQGLAGGFALGHAGHLQVGFDRRQRAAQFVGGVAGQPAFAFDGLGRPRFLTAAQVERIAGRPDEHYRQRALGL